jgi:hypothetical protein
VPLSTDRTAAERSWMLATEDQKRLNEFQLWQERNPGRPRREFLYEDYPRYLLARAQQRALEQVATFGPGAEAAGGGEDKGAQHKGA